MAFIGLPSPVSAQIQPDNRQVATTAMYATVVSSPGLTLQPLVTGKPSVAFGAARSGLNVSHRVDLPDITEAEIAAEQKRRPLIEVPSITRKFDDLARLSNDAVGPSYIEINAKNASFIRLAVTPLVVDVDAMIEIYDRDDHLLQSYSWRELQARVRANPDGYVSGEVWLTASRSSDASLRIAIVAKADAARLALTALRRYELGIVRAPSSSGQKREQLKVGFQPCFTDIACVPSLISTSAAAATVRLTRSTGCTGTLITDSLGSGTAYIATAAHCFGGTDVEAQDEANRVSIEWYYQVATCDPASTLSPLYRPASEAGADLLYRGAFADGGPDVVLLRLRELPSDIPVVFAPWSSGYVNIGDALAGIHHARLYVKKGSQGNANSFTRCRQGAGLSIQCGPNVSGASNVLVNWNAQSGLTAPGSSGSGLFSNGALIGVLSGGSATATCSSGGGNASPYGLYVFLGEAMAALAPFLNPPQNPPNLSVMASIFDLITESTCTLDIDGDGVIKPATDGVLLLRTLFGFTGNAVTANALGTPPAGRSLTRGTWPLIKSHIDDMRASLALDLDGDNKVSAMREGLIVLRVMLGLSGEAALSGSGVSLSAWPRIVTRLKENCGVTVQ